jgi:chromosomal replication initiation ATPase DnaA
MRQPRLFEFRMGERSPETLIVSRANEAAVALLKDWRSWPGGALALVGPAWSGKTHLAMAWALEADARAGQAGASPEAMAELFAEAGGRVWIDNAGDAGDEAGQRDAGQKDAGQKDAGQKDAGLWRLLDLARTRGGAVLLAARTPPAKWPVDVADLKSRLQALPCAHLGEPDEFLIEAVLHRVCREHFIELSQDAARYLAQRLPRTFAAAQSVAIALDAHVRRAARPVTAAEVKRALRLAGEQGQLAPELSEKS